MRYTTMQTTNHIRRLALTLAVTAILGPVRGTEEDWERERDGYWHSMTAALANENPKAPRVVGVEYDGDETGHALILFLADRSISIIDQLNEEEEHGPSGTAH